MLKDINKENLHHAYLLLGNRDFLLPKVMELIEGLGTTTVSNPDFFKLEIDTFKIEDARTLKSLTSEKTFGSGEDTKKVFVIAANQFLLEAQNTLLKIFEEPRENVHFFIISPNVQTFVPTLLSRFFVIKNAEEGLPHACGSPSFAGADNPFLNMNLAQRIEFIKNMLAEPKEEDEEESAGDSPRTVALNLLNSIEGSLYQKFLNNKFTKLEVFEHIFKVRHNLRQPGSAPKMLLESVALAIPEKV
ncbi:MAG: hypothetical protein KGZ37_10435 [Nitrosarchaeum sp.]|nr:hypothetical protein [Nitrosarchaeum sp.]